MNPLKSFIISVGRTEVFNHDVIAPNGDMALTLAKADWNQHGVANWMLCGTTGAPLFQIEDEIDVCRRVHEQRHGRSQDQREQRHGARGRRD